MKSRSLTVALCLALLTLPALADTIVLSNGRELTGLITKETYAKVEYRRQGSSSSQTVNTDEVLSIDYGKTSPEYREAEKMWAEGKMGEAASYFLGAAEDKDLPAHVRATAYALTGEALLANANFEEAAGFYDQLLKQFPDTRHLAAALLGKGTALLQTRQYAAAAGVFQQLKDDAASKSLGERWGHEANFNLLLSAEAQKKQGVTEGYKELRALTKADYPAIANKCSLRLGRVNLANSRAAEAQAMFEEIIEGRLGTDDGVVAGAYNGRGRVAFGKALGTLSTEVTSDSQKQAQVERAKEYFHAALLDHLRVVVSYPGIRAEQAEALYFAGQSFLNLSSLDPELSGWRLRGQQLIKRCADNFAGSEWAAKAAAEL